MDIHFEPWVGENYGTSGIFGIPLLILGESHYEWIPGVDTPDLTKRLIAEDANNEWSHRHLTIIFRVVMGEVLTSQRRHEFWHSLGYYNFLQRMVGNGPGIVPNRHLWQEAVQPFFKVLRQLKPACLLVLGQRLWQNLPVPTGMGPILRVNHETMDTRIYGIDGGGQVLAGRINHPASMGFKASYWHAWVMALSNEAKRMPGNAGRIEPPF